MIDITIILPVYNVAKHIERSLQSVLRQDYQGVLECIIVDDCTLDNSMKIIDKLLSGYDGRIIFKIYHHKQNLGLSAARNTGTVHAMSDYVFYLDSDDEIMPNAVSTLADLAIKYTGVDIVYGDWYLPKASKGLYNDSRLPEYTDNRKDIVRYLLSGAVSMTGQNKLIRKQYILDNNLSFKEGIVYEDSLYTYYLANTAHSIAVSFVPIYIYYLNLNGITSVTTRKHLLSKIILVSDILDSKEDLSLGYKYSYCINFLNGTLRKDCEEYGLSSLVYANFQRLQYKAFKDGFYLIAFMAFVNRHCTSEFFEKLYRSFGYRVFRNIVLRKYRCRKY